MSTLATLIIAPLLWPFLAMWRAYCVIVIWNWFVLPATGIIAPTMHLVVGMMMALALILPIHKTKPEEGDILSNYFGNVIAYELTYPALALGTAWAWKWLQWGLA